MTARALRSAALVALALPLLVGFGDKGEEPTGDEPVGSEPSGENGGTTAGTDLDRAVPFTEVDGETLYLDAITTPAEDGPRPGVIIVHGGGWVTGDPEDYRPFARSLALGGWATFSIEYRLDENPGHPAEVEDVEASIAWVRDHAADYDVDPDQIALLGSSAGGNLAVLAADATHDVEGGPVAAVASLSGPLDLPGILEQDDRAPDVEEKIEDYLDCSFDDCSDLWEDASPITFVDADDPPMFLANGTDEPIPEEQATSMGEALDEAGVTNQVEVVDTQVHGHSLVGQGDVWEDLVAFLAEQFDVEVPEVPPVRGNDRSSTSSGGESGGESGGGGGERAAPVERESSSDSSSLVPVLVAIVVIALAVAGAVALGLRRRPPLESAA